MDIDRGKGKDRMYYIYGKWGYIVKKCWQKKRREKKIVEILQESAKDNRE